MQKVRDVAQFVTYVGVDHRFGDNLNIDFDYFFIDGLYADYSITVSAFTEV